MTERTRRDVLRGAAGIGAAATLAGCIGGGGDGEVKAMDAPDGTEIVEVGPDDSYKFTPEELTVSTGTTVRFVWLSGGHNVAVTSQPADANWSGHDALEDRGFHIEHTFEVPGRYEYVCTPHRSYDMLGAVVAESSE
jgi:plastocyanin